MSSHGPNLNILILNNDSSFLVDGNSSPNIFLLLWKALQEQSLQAEAEGLSMDRFGAMVAFACSHYGITTLVVAVILNRTAVIASTHRQRRPYGRHAFSTLLKDNLSNSIVLTCLRISAVAFMIEQIRNILTTLWVLQKTANPLKLARLTMLVPSHFFEYVPEHHVSLYMQMPRTEVRFGPTSAMLWPVFCSMCFSLFTETFCSSILGDKPFLGGGTTLFEIAFAIQEVSSSFLIGTNKVAKRPSEKVLVICLFLLVDHIMSHLGSIVNKNKYRLIPLTIITSLFVWYFTASFFSGVSEALEFPLSISVVYLCLIFVLAVTLLSFSILLLAILAKCSNLQELNYASYFWSTDDDTDFFSKHLSLSLSQDFYTAAMNVGLFAVSLAGKSSYMKECNAITYGTETWLEESLWSRIKSQFKIDGLTSESKLVKNGKILAYLKENNVSGYSNIVNTPSFRLVNGTEKREGPEKLPIMKMRYEYVKAIGLRFALLIYSWIFKFVIRYWPSTILGKILNRKPKSGHEEYVERNLTPYFVQSVVRPSKSDNGVDEVVDLEEFTEEILARHYVDILRNQTLADIDTSPDFTVEFDLEADPEYDSEVEEIDISQASFFRGRESELFKVTPSDEVSEIIFSENLDEFLQEENLKILREHIQYDNFNMGPLTRLRYRELTHDRSTFDEPAKLLDLLLSKRKRAPQGEHDTSNPSIYDDIDSRFACVICQVSPREIITWPCKCLSICEGCRLTLVSKGLEGCVTCRRDVEGVSKVYIP